MSTYANPKKRKFPLKWLLLGVAAGVAIYYGPGLFKGKDPAAEQAAMGPMPTPVAPVIAKPVVVWSEFSGRLEAVSAAEIRPQVSGQIAAVHFKDGEQVKKGQLLFTIDPRAYEAEVARAKGAVIAAQSAQKNSAQELARAQVLVKSKSISKAEFERAQSAAAQGAGNLAAAQGALAAAQVNLDYAHITAPISGKISRAELTVGNLVQAGPNAPLLASVVSLSPIYASFELDEQTFLKTIQGVPAAKLKTIPVQVGVASDKDTPIEATIHSFDNQIAAGSGTIRVRAVVPNKDGALVPGLFARVRIGSPDAAPSILINPTTIGTDQNKKFVLVVNAENKTEYREVVLGALIDGMQVVTGLNEGEQIVVAGLQRMKPGMPVTPIPSDMMTLKPLNAPEGAPAEGATPAEKAAE